MSICPAGQKLVFDVIPGKGISGAGKCVLDTSSPPSQPNGTSGSDSAAASPPAKGTQKSTGASPVTNATPYSRIINSIISLLKQFGATIRIGDSEFGYDSSASKFYKIDGNGEKQYFENTEDFKKSLQEALIAEKNDLNIDKYTYQSYLNAIISQILKLKLEPKNPTIFLSKLVGKVKEAVSASKNKRIDKAVEKVVTRDEIVKMSKVHDLSDARKTYEAAREEFDKNSTDESLKKRVEAAAQKIKDAKAALGNASLDDAQQLAVNNADEQLKKEEERVATEKEKADKAAEQTRKTAVEAKRAEELREKQGTLLLTIIKIGKTKKEVFDKALKNAKMPPLTDNQRILSFSENGAEYVILVERDAEGNWKGPQKYYAETGNGKTFTVRFDDDSMWSRDPEFKATEITLKPSESSRHATYTTKKGATYAWEDKDGDGKIDRNEADSVIQRVPGPNGAPIEIKGINAENFDLTNQRMDAETKAAAGDDELDRSELEVRDAAIADFAEDLGMAPDKAHQAYHSSKFFRNVSRKELKETKGEIVAGLNGIGIKGLSLDAARGKLKELDYRSNIIDVILKSWDSRKDRVNIGREIAEEMLRCAMASLTGLYDVFGVKKEDLGGISAFNPKKVTKGNLQEWLKTGKVEKEEEEVEEGEEVESVGGSISDPIKAAKKIAEAKNVDAVLKIYKKLNSSLKSNSEIVQQVYQRIAVDFNKPDNALGFVKEKLPKGVLKNHLSQKLFELYMNDDNLVKAKEAATLISDKDTRHKCLIQIAEKYRTLRTDERQEALKIVKEIKGERSGQPGWQVPEMKKGNQPVTLEDYEQELQAELKIPLDLVKLRDQAIPGGTYNSESADAALTQLDNIINSTDPAVAAEKKAYAKMTKAQILAKQAEWCMEQSKNKEALEAAYKAQKLYKEAREELVKNPANSKNCEKITREMTMLIHSIKGLRSSDVKIMTAAADPKKKGSKPTEKKPEEVIKEMIDMLPDNIPDLESGGTMPRKDFSTKILSNWKSLDEAAKRTSSLSGSGDSGPSAASVGGKVDSIIASTTDARPAKVAKLSAALAGLKGKNQAEAAAILQKVKSAGFKVQLVANTEGKITSISVR